MKPDDYIRVKHGIIDPDFKDRSLSGFTGMIEDVNGEFISILWDENTLKKN